MDKPMTITMITKLLTDLTTMFNVNQNMSPMQIVTCAEDIVDSNEYSVMHLEDFGPFIIMARRGELGKIEYSLDQSKIFGMLKVFLQERDKAQAKKRDAERERNISNMYAINALPVVIDAVKIANDKLSIKEQPEPVKTERKMDLGQLFLQEWDKLPTKENGGVIFRVYNGIEFFAVNDYLSCRLLEVSEQLKNEDQ
jgi:hypothetical protein